MTELVIRVTSLSFETPYTGLFEDPLQNIEQSTQSLIEVVESLLSVRVTWLNLEVPVTSSLAETLAISQLATHSLYEDVIEPPSPVQPTDQGGVGLPMYLVGGFKQQYKQIITIRETDSESTQRVEEAFVSVEELMNTMLSKQGFDAIHRRISVEGYYLPAQEEKPIRIITEPKETKIFSDEEELILLGIL